QMLLHFRDPYAHYSREKMLAYIGRLDRPEVLPAPMEYSNLGFAVLGIGLERASGKRYEALLMQDVLRPARMTSATLDNEVAVHGGLSDGHNSNGDVIPHWHIGAFAAAGAVKASANDMVRMLEKAMRREAPFDVDVFSPQTRWDGGAIGLGW